MKRAVALLLLVLVVLTAVAPVLAGGPDLGFIPETVYENRVPVYDLFSVEDFRVDGDYSILENVTDAASPLNTATSLLLMWNAIVVKLTVRFLEWAFTTHLVDVLLPYVEAGLDMVSQALLASSLVKIGFILAGGFALYQMVRGRIGQAVWAVMGLFLLLVAFGWLLGGGLVYTVTLANNASTEISGAVMAAPITGSRPSTEDAVIDAGVSVFTAMAIEPWAIAEFGNLETANRYGVNVPGDIVLTKSAAERQRWYKGLSGEERTLLKYWRVDGTLPRLCIAASALLCSLVFGLIVGLMCLSLIGAELWLLILVFVAPGVALGSYLMSWMGWAILGRWLQEILGALAQKIALALGLGVVLMLYRVIHFAFVSEGWLMPLVLQIIMVVFLFANRRRLARIFTGIKQAPASALERFLVQRMALDAAGASARAIAAYPGKVRERRQQARLERKAKATLAQKLASDQLQAAETGRVTPLMKRVNHRMQLGARQPFTQAEIKAEAARVRSLEEIGADPLAVAAGSENTPQYWSRVERVRRQRERAERELRATRSTVRPMVQQQALQRSVMGRTLTWLRGGPSQYSPGRGPGAATLPTGTRPQAGQQPQGGNPVAGKGARKAARPAPTTPAERSQAGRVVQRPGTGPAASAKKTAPTGAPVANRAVAQPTPVQPPAGSAGRRLRVKEVRSPQSTPVQSHRRVEPYRAPGDEAVPVVNEHRPQLHATASGADQVARPERASRIPGRAPLRERKRLVALALARAIARRAFDAGTDRKDGGAQ